MEPPRDAITYVSIRGRRNSYKCVKDGGLLQTALKQALFSASGYKAWMLTQPWLSTLFITIRFDKIVWEAITKDVLGI